MINDIINNLKNKKIVILGFGREGIATYKLIRRHLPNKEIYIRDKNENIKNNELIKNDNNIILELGDNYLDNLDKFDLILKSPGIAFNTIDISSFKDKITSELELLLKFYKGKIIAITGTKGKSTTSSLIYQMIKDNGYKVLLAGNIGTAVFEYIDELESLDYLVLELGCHQLEFVTHSPNYSILLNIFEEHLDHYRSYDGYIEAKCNIFTHQNKNDYFIYNYDNEIIVNKVNKYKPVSNMYSISFNGNEDATTYLKDEKIYYNNEEIYDINDKRKLLGMHNVNNIMFVLTLAEILKLDMKKTVKTINTFNSLPHRIEYVGEFNGITYYNDSISTIPEACMNALKSLKVNTLILGGLNRGIDYSELISFINNYNLDNLICIPDTGSIIAECITNKNTKVYLENDLLNAINRAKEVTKKGGICLLSPAAASYNTFKNFEERGDFFKEHVKSNN
jgi:UDP-N-acetylmuramoylalanine--D-glutamate ligase